MTTVKANGVTLGVERFGDAAAPLVLLAGGTTMLSWPDALCEALAGGGRHVVRYDLRDSGASTTVSPKAPAYTLRDLAADAAALARELDDRPAHLAGIGVSGMVAQVAALEHPTAFSALTLVGTRSVAAGRIDADLPDHDAATMKRLFSRSMPDWADRAAVAEFAAAGAEILGNDPGAARATAERIWDRTPGTEPAVQMANELGMVFAKLNCKPRWRKRLPELSSGRRLRQRGLQLSLANTMPSWLAICTAGSVPGVRSQMRSAVARAAPGSLPRISAPAAANSATAARSAQSGMERENSRFIVAASWSGRSASIRPAATDRVPTSVSAENAVGCSSAATWATIPLTPMPARCAGRSSSSPAKAAASAARSRSLYAGAFGSTMVDSPQSRRS